MRVAANFNNIQILSDELTDQEAESYCRYAVTERDKVEAFWGPTWKEPIRIHVDSSYQISKALLPAYQGNRGFMEMPLISVQRNSGPLLHEMVHIYAPNDNRFLAEGLAVYLQCQFGGNPVIYTLENDLNDLARDRISQISSLQFFNSVRTPAPLGKDRKDVEGRRTAYIIGGSFVGFLIEKYGLDQFKRVYESGDYSRLDGKSLEILEREWRVNLQDR
jgi:hypothetical protein